MKTILPEDLEQMDRLYRINLINSLSGYKSANMIGTQDQDGQANLAIVSSVTHIGSDPAIFGFVTRPHVVPRHTYENILQTGVYTINHVHGDFTAQAHQTSAKYAKDEDEFEQCGFTKEYSTVLKAPYVKESVIQLGMEYLESIPIKLNDTILVLGKLIEIRLKNEVLQSDGFVDLHKAQTITINGLDAYLSPQPSARYAYARPHQPTKRLDNEK